MSGDDDATEPSGFWVALAMGTAAAVTAACLFGWRGNSRGDLSEAQALALLNSADPFTPEGRRDLAEAQTALALIERRRRGETVDEGAMALERMRAAGNWGWDPEGRAFSDSLQDFERAVTRPLDPDPAGWRADPVSHHTCPVCRGTGNSICPRCRGGGHEQVRTFFGQISHLPCSLCGGPGSLVCKMCDGRRELPGRA